MIFSKVTSVIISPQCQNGVQTHFSPSNAFKIYPFSLYFLNMEILAKYHRNSEAFLNSLPLKILSHFWISKRLISSEQRWFLTWLMRARNGPISLRWKWTGPELWDHVIPIGVTAPVPVPTTLWGEWWINSAELIQMNLIVSSFCSAYNRLTSNCKLFRGEKPSQGKTNPTVQDEAISY